MSTIRKIYGIRKSNGSKPSHWIRGAGGLARKALQVRQSARFHHKISYVIKYFSAIIKNIFPQALESLKVVEKDTNGGRRLTSQGRRDLDRIAAQIKAKNRAAAAATVVA